MENLLNNAGYDIFLSYRHKPLDNKVCKKTHTLLETFKAPKRLKQANIKRVFRDDDELPVAGVLSDTIGEALKSAKVLLVICSPDTPESQWVDREVRTFIEMCRSDRIYALLIEGTAETSFPPSLKLVPGIESRTIKAVSKSDKHRSKLLKKELVRVIAAATDTPFDPLRISIKRRGIRRSILAGAALTVLFLASGLYSLFKWSEAQYYNLYAQKEEIIIHQVITNATFNLVNQLEEIPEASKGLIEVLNNNIQYLDRMVATEGNKGSETQALKDKGDNYLNLVRAYIMEGNIEKASSSAKEAVQIFDSLNKNALGSDISRLANSYTLAGLYMHSLSRENEATDYLEKALAVYQEIDEKEPGDEIKKSLADCRNALAVCYYFSEKYKEAADQFIEEAKVKEQLLNKDSTAQERKGIPDIKSAAAECLVAYENYKVAGKYSLEASEEYKKLYEETNDASIGKAYVASLYSLSTTLLHLKDKDAEYYHKVSLVEADKLVKGAMPDFNTTYLGMYAMYFLLYGQPADMQTALDISYEAYSAAPDDAFLHHVYAYSLLFNNQYDSAVSELKLLIDNKSSKPEVILDDMELFKSRGRENPDLVKLEAYLTELGN